ncbi:MAG: Hachiman antiphage defense system protein HamA, partial [archaeon]
SSTENYDKKKYDFEISLASGNLSEDLSEDMKKTIKDYLNPARPDLSKFKEVHAIFLGYQYDLIKSCEASACGEERYTKIIEGYKKEISNYLNKIEAGFEKHPKLQNTHFLFFIIPFRDLNGFKEGFKQGIIGV